MRNDRRDGAADPASREGAGFLAVILSLVLAIAATVFLLVFPTVTEVGGSATVSASGGVLETATVHHRTLVESQGWSVAVELLVPVILSGAPVALHRNRFRWAACTASAVLLGLFVAVTGFSIGILYVASAATMIIAAVLAAAGRPAADEG